MKTYAKSKGESNFNWNKALDIEIARKGKGFRKWTNNQNNLLNKSMSFVTCAVGNLCASIPRNDQDEPLDSILKNLGQSFYEFIECEHYEDAKIILERIEIRSSFLLSKLSLKILKN